MKNNATFRLRSSVDFISAVRATGSGSAGDQGLKEAGYDQRMSLECGRFERHTGLEPVLAEVRRQWASAKPRGYAAA